MAPRELEPLIKNQLSMEARREEDDLTVNNDEPDRNSNCNQTSSHRTRHLQLALVLVLLLLLMCGGIFVVFVNGIWSSFFSSSSSSSSSTNALRFRKTPTGPYKLLQKQVGRHFWDFYDFYQGADSLGSAGYQTYVSKSKALDELHIANVTTDQDGTEFVYMFSKPGPQGEFRDSIRLEGKQRFERGLFILDVAHMPSGCGVWPAFWMTDEDTWPKNGEIDILEGINSQTVAKTALHTSEECSMFAHVPAYAHDGTWDTATGLPDTFTGQPNYINRVEADNCWVMTPHQWANQGCVAVSNENGTIGEPMNAIGGGVYVLEWDPANKYIRSWVFPRPSIPSNLQLSMDTAGQKEEEEVIPDPSAWPLPYAYFAIGEGTGCSSDHFQNMRLVFNLAFCGTVAGNRFVKDCPALYEQYNVHNDSVLTCNAYLETQPEALKEAYWKIKGVYVYEREYERPATKNGTHSQGGST